MRSVASACSPGGMSARWSYGMKRASMPECTFNQTWGSKVCARAKIRAVSGSLHRRNDNFVTCSIFDAVPEHMIAVCSQAGAQKVCAGAGGELS